MLRKNIYRICVVIIVVSIPGFFISNSLILSNSDAPMEIIPPASSDLNDYEEVWNRTWGVVADTDIALDLAVDSSNDIYVTGFSGEFGPMKLSLMKFSSNGDLYWNITWGTSGERGDGIALDSLGNAFIVGYTRTYGAGSNDVLLMKYNSSGGMQWYKTWGTSQNEGATDIVIDSNDNIYVSGFTSSYGAGSADMVLFKYNSTGDLQWYRTWGTSGSEWGDSVAINEFTGHIYMSGSSMTDAFVVCYNSSGHKQWDESFDGGPSDGARGIAADSIGNVYVTGYTDKAGVGNEVLLWKINSTGDTQWNRTWGGTGSDRGQNVVVDSNDDVFVAGFYQASDYEAAILKYDSQGNYIFNFTWGATGLDYGIGIILDLVEDIYISGVSYLTDPSWGDSFILKLTNDNITPEIEIQAPVQDAIFSDYPPIYEISIIEDNLDSIWYTVDMGITNYTVTELTGFLDQTAWNNIPDGFIQVRFYVNDSKNQVSFDEVVIVKDTVKFLHIEAIELTCSTENFNVTLFLGNETNDGIDFATFQIWWNRTDVSTDVENLGNGWYYIPLEPITVPPGVDPILLNMTIQAEGYEDKYFEFNIAIDPVTLQKEPEPPITPLGLILAILGTFIAIILSIIGLFWFILKKKKKT